MSVKSLWFDFDALLVGRHGAIVCKGERRFRMSGLPEESLGLIAALREQSARCHSEMLPSALARQLVNLGLVCEDDGTRQDRPLGSLVALSPRHTQALVAPIRWLGSAIGLAVVAALAAALLFLGGWRRLAGEQSLATWITGTSLIDLLAAAAIFFLCVCIHEMGHAAACVWHTGTVGGVRFKTYRGAPAVAIDVSSIVLTGRVGKSAVALAGLLFQLLFSAVLLATVHNEVVQWGARMSVWAALFTLLPLPRADGYWFLVDASGRYLSPRLFPRPASVADLIYGVALALASIVLMRAVAGEAWLLMVHAYSSFSRSPGRAVLFGGGSIYAVVVVVLFIRTTVMQAFKGMEMDR